MENTRTWMVLGAVTKSNKKILDSMTSQIYTANQLSDICSCNKFRLETMTDFCNLLNNQDINLEHYWFTYIHLKF